MVFTLKRQILRHLKTIVDIKYNNNASNLNEYFFVKTLLPQLMSNKSHSVKYKFKNPTKPTFYVDLVNSDNINENISDNIRNSFTFITKVYTEVIDENRRQLRLEIDEQFFFKQLVNELKGGITNYGKETLISESLKCETIIVEFSSPNIAKPFHVGNFRSTIIGNFVANINSFYGHNVIRLNYLGDWGTQFGILSLAYDYFGDDCKLASDPLKHLFDVYVKGNNECANSEDWREKAKQRFYLLESGHNSDALKQWQQFRQLSVEALKLLYSRLGISFDGFHSESMYSRASIELIKKYKNLNCFVEGDDGAVFAVIKDDNNSDNTDVKVPVMKKDGSTLYLTRDISAAIHRREMYNFDKMYYVVDSTQFKHFNNLKNILKETGNNFYRDIIHLKFGRILGMSSRRGEIVFLDDVLDEAKDRAIESAKSSPNTKIDIQNDDNVAEIVGVSGVIIHDMSHRRGQNYNFDWDAALRHVGNTGVVLQYTHSRLCNLQTNCGVDLDLDFQVDFDAVNNDEGKALIYALAKFDDILNDTYDQLEPKILVDYLFYLKSATNRAYQVFNIKGENINISKSRLLLFYCTRMVLSQGMKLLGLTPLKSM